MKNILFYILLIFIILYNSWKNSVYQEGFDPKGLLNEQTRSLRKTFNINKEYFKNKVRRIIK